LNIIWRTVLGDEMNATLEKALTSKVLQLEAKLRSDERGDEEFHEILKMYFNNGRPKWFSKYKPDLLSSFPEVLETVPIENMVEIAHTLFLFVRTSNYTLSDRENQDEINRYVFEPFQKHLAKMLPHIQIEELIFEPVLNTYVIVTRHAMTQGTYAPGKFIYSVCKALLKAKSQVILCYFGNIDETFKCLKNFGKFSSFHIGGRDLSQFFALRQLINEVKPVEVLTEIELSVLNLIEAIGVSSKISLLSAGVYKAPWFDKKYLVPELYQDEDEADVSLVPIPQVHSKDLLAPPCSPETLDELKRKYNLEGKFIIGSFARYEKFTPEFIEMVKKCLNTVKNSVLVLAGPNDQSTVADLLSDEIRQERVVLFGVVNTNILGWIIDVFLDPFPGIAGFAALESLAKGKPVFTLEYVELGNYLSSRDKALVFKDQKKLLAQLSCVAKSPERYRLFSQKSLEIAGSFYDDSTLARSIVGS
jgi:hypothetical protein